jgi:hypothetical protein
MALISYNVYFLKKIRGPLMPFAAVPGVLGTMYLLIAVIGFNKVNTTRDKQVNVLVNLRLQLQMDSPLPKEEKDNLDVLLQCMIRRQTNKDKNEKADETAHLRIFGFRLEERALYVAWGLLLNAFSLAWHILWS